MFVVSKKYYYFDENDKVVFLDFLTRNGITRTDFAKMCGISLTLLTLLFNSKRAITKEIAQAFTSHGFKVNVGD